MAKFGIGQGMKRKEDQRFLTGQGRLPAAVDPGYRVEPREARARCGPQGGGRVLGPREPRREDRPERNAAE